MRYIAIFLLTLIFTKVFLYEPYKIPSDSMVPTLLKGDHIWVNKFVYGARLPGTKYWLWHFSGPARGDVMVFTHPVETEIDFIKRVVGVPGDVIAMRQGRLMINGVAVDETTVETKGQDPSDPCVAALTLDTAQVVPDTLQPLPFIRGRKNRVTLIEGFSRGHNHLVQYVEVRSADGDFEVKVPDDSYFVMGDNRDRSRDSRFWGMVPRDYLIGRATSIWLSLNHEGIACASPFTSQAKGSKVFRWYRFLRGIY